MGKHHKPTLIRAWVDDYVQLPSAFVTNWEEGLDGFARFSLAIDSALTCAIREHRHKVGFTVEGASAVEWWLDTCHYDDWGMRVVCISRDAHARRSLLDDGAIIWLWLEAEKIHKEAA